MAAGVSYFDDREGAGGEVIVREIGLGDPDHLAGVAGRRQAAADRSADVIDEDVVILGAAGIVGDDSLEDFEDGERSDFESGFLEDFTTDGGFEALAGFDEAAGQAPPTLEGLVATLDQENSIILENEGTDAEERGRAG